MADDKPTPLQLLSKRTTPITDVVYGADHPRKQPKRPPQRPVRGGDTGTSLVKDVLDTDTLHKLSALQGKLERQSRMDTRKESK